jgi:hypothetical protein
MDDLKLKLMKNSELSGWQKKQEITREASAWEL